MRLYGLPYVIAILATVGAPIKIAHADFFDGNYLHAACNADKSETGKIRFCHGYVAAVGAALDCVPEVVKLGQVIDVVARYLRDHPEERHFSAHSVATHAITEAFCN